MKKTLKTILCVLLAGTFIITAGYFLDFTSKAVSRQIYPCRYANLVESCAGRYEVPAEIVYAVIKTESGFRETAKSAAGAVGLMQLMPATFAWISVLREEVRDPALIWDAQTNIEYGVYLLRYLYDHYQNWDIVFAAYNAGMSRVNEWLQDEQISSGGVLVHIPYAETKEYIQKVNHAIAMYRLLYPF